MDSVSIDSPRDLQWQFDLVGTRGLHRQRRDAGCRHAGDGSQLGAGPEPVRRAGLRRHRAAFVSVGVTAAFRAARINPRPPGGRRRALPETLSLARRMALARFSGQPFRNGTAHELIEHRHGERRVAMRGAPDPAFADQAASKRPDSFDCASRRLGHCARPVGTGPEFGHRSRVILFAKYGHPCVTATMRSSASASMSAPSPRMGSRTARRAASSASAPIAG